MDFVVILLCCWFRHTPSVKKKITKCRDRLLALSAINQELQAELYKVSTCHFVVFTVIHDCTIENVQLLRVCGSGGTFSYSKSQCWTAVTGMLLSLCHFFSSLLLCRPAKNDLLCSMSWSVFMADPVSRLDCFHC